MKNVTTTRTRFSKARRALIVRPGFIIMISFGILLALLLLGTFILSFVLSEHRISLSQAESIKNYYLAEAGAQEAIWKLENDLTWKNSFETNPTWTDQFTRDPALVTNGSYQVDIANTDLAQGEITSRGTVTLSGGASANRVIRTRVFKAQGSLSIGDSAIATGSNKIDFTASIVNVNPGSIFANNNILVQLLSDVDVQNEASATNNITIQAFSSLTAGGGLHAANYPPAPAAIAMPAIDFDSADASSYKNRADVIYSESEFENLLWSNPNLTLNGITYVTGSVKLRGDTHLTINGVLVTDSTIEIGKTFCWFRPGYGTRCGNSSVTVNRTPGQPAGLLTKSKFEVEVFVDDISITGLLYALGDIKLTSLGGAFTITGGIIGQKLTTVSVWSTITIAFDENTVAETTGEALFSPVVTIEHWEEEY